MSKHMDQAEIDALLKDSMFQDSSIHDSPQPKQLEEPQSNYEESNAYGNQEFESYDESRRTFNKNNSKNDFNDNKKQAQESKAPKKLADIKEESTPQIHSKQKKQEKSQQKPRPKTGIYFYPPKQHTATATVSDKKHLPYNYVRLQQREKELLLTTLNQEVRQLKQQNRRKDNEHKKLQNAYKNLLQEKAHQAASVRQATLQKQLAALQSKYDKMQNLAKIERQRNVYRPSKTATMTQNFVPEQKVSQREQELLDIIDKLKERLMSTNTELKTLQAKMSQGEDYIEQLKRKMRRVEQLQFKMQKMAEQAQNDRQYIKQLKEKNTKLQSQLYEVQKEKRLIEVQVRRYELGQATQNDTLAELAEVRKEKQRLERSLRELASNTISKQGKNKAQWTGIEDSGELLKP